MENIAGSVWIGHRSVSSATTCSRPPAAAILCAAGVFFLPAPEVIKVDTLKTLNSLGESGGSLEMQGCSCGFFEQWRNLRNN